MAVIWEDVTSYSRGEWAAGCKPRTWQATVGSVDLTVTRHRDYEPDVWLIESLPFVSRRPASSKELEEAKRELIVYVASAAQAILKGMKS